MEVITKTAKQTRKLGEEFAWGLKGNKIIGLIGELGSGKTTFVQGLARGLGIKKRIISPTFIFIRSYDAKNAKIRREKREKFITRNLYHIDLYRLDSVEDAQSLGLEEIWLDPKNIVVIEWAEKIEKILPKKTVKIYFEYVGETERRIKISNF